MGVWFQGSGEISCPLAEVTGAFVDPGTVFVGIVGHMPGITRVALVERGSDFVVIRTNEGLMTRSGISQQPGAERLIVEYDERYEAGTKVTTTTHFTHEFVAHDGGVTHHLTMRDVTAPGFVGFLYRAFGKSNIGNALLEAHKSFFESDSG